VCPVVGFCVSSVELRGSTGSMSSRALVVIKGNLKSGPKK
jgi:hypothetical protein